METTESQPLSDSYGWLIALGVLFLAILILLCGPQGLIFDALRGLMTGLALCSALTYLVLTFLPVRFR